MTSSSGPGRKGQAKRSEVTSIAPSRPTAITRGRLARPVELERTCTPDRESMLSPTRKPVDLLAPTGRLTRTPDDDALLRLAVWLADVAEEAALRDPGLVASRADGSADEPPSAGSVP